MNATARAFWLLWGGAHGFSLHSWLTPKSHMLCSWEPLCWEVRGGAEAPGEPGCFSPAEPRHFSRQHLAPPARMEAPLDTRGKETGPSVLEAGCGGQPQSWPPGSGRQRSTTPLTQGKLLTGAWTRVFLEPQRKGNAWCGSAPWGCLPHAACPASLTALAGTGLARVASSPTCPGRPSGMLCTAAV